MSDPIIERFDIASEQEAMDFATVLELGGKTCEVEAQSNSLWMVRAYPAGFGSTEPAKNEKTPEEPPIETPIPEDPPTGGVQGLLDFLGKFESGNNFNAYFAHARNDNDPRLTSMLLGSVVDWQREFVRGGSPSSAAGKYQIIRPTLQTLIRDMNLDATRVRFSSDTQDAMARHLLKRRKLDDYIAGQLSTEAFALNIAKEWASMPVIAAVRGSKGHMLQPGQSYYAGDGLNKSLVGIESYRRALEGARA